MQQEWSSTFNRLYEKYQRNAKQRDVPFKLFKEDFHKLVTSKCYLCGVEPKQKFQHMPKRNTDIILYNGIDRMNPLKGYTLKNSRTCCWRCNKMKAAMTLAQFKNHIKKLAEFIL